MRRLCTSSPVYVHNACGLPAQLPTAYSARNVYAHTHEECEEKLKVLIIEMKTELAELKRKKAEGKLPPQEPAKGKKKG